MPLPPFEFIQVTCVTPTLSEALPDRLMDELPAVKVLSLVGDFIETTGSVVSGGV